MLSGVVSNLNSALGFGLQRAAIAKQSLSILIEPPLSRKSSASILSFSNCESLRLYSSSQCGGRAMAASGSLATAGDLVVDCLVSNCSSNSSFVKPSGVYFNDRSYRNCRQGRVSMRNGKGENYMGIHGYLVFNLDQRPFKSSPSHSKGLSSFRTLSSSCYSKGAAPEVTTDAASLNTEQLSSLTLSSEQPTPSNSILKLLSGACYMPHPAKEATGGEDAHFICADEQAIGVADGVGGWADVGVDAGEYARELMSNSVTAIRELPDVDPLQVLEKAHARTKAMGSSTACIIALKDKDLHAINLGDSGFVVVRDGRTIFESPVQQHGFNFTYQLENGSRGDLPSSGQVFEIPVAPGDVVVAGSDGLFDNLYAKEVAAVVEGACNEGFSPDATAQRIAGFARARAVDRKRQTPFSTAAQEAGYVYYGGKLDDITVVVAYVTSSTEA